MAMTANNTTMIGSGATSVAGGTPIVVRLLRLDR